VAGRRASSDFGDIADMGMDALTLDVMSLD
jgi:hypothetical protein